MLCKQKLTSGVAAAAMLVAIAGCGGAKPARSGATAPGSAPVTSVNEPASQPSTPAPQPAAPVKPASPTPPAPPRTSPPSSQAGSLAFTTIARGQQSSGHERNAVLVQDEASLNAQGIRPQQSVNFSQESVLVVYMGEQRTGGYSVEITSVKLEGGKLVVTVKQHRPDPASMVTQALTQPYHAVKMPKVPAGTQVSVNWV